ncbi:ankyrin repeat domain-containing protein 27-like [Tubulanus polymorphus]|uniref:ankyrin repeat domain-containing protein 27-like n=1 Tax=Tubulanus polymorphus TaxID=672921 RepID=UPI003DA2D395
MMNTYDEDITENKFFITFQNKYPELCDEVTNNRWIICVPRGNSNSKYVYTEIDFKNHVLKPESEDSHKYTTLSDKEVIIQGSTITTSNGFPDLRVVPILFDETYFNKNDESYRILCVNTMLEGGPAEVESSPAQITLHSMDDCTELLWGHTENRRTKRSLIEIIELFNKSYDCLQGETLIHYVDAANALFTRAMQIVLKDSFVKRTARHNKMYMDNIKIAVETFVMHGIFMKVFEGITLCLANKDAQLNKITRNLAHLQLRDLGVTSGFSENIPRARKELTSLCRYSTPIGKLYCIRRVIMALMQTPRSSKKSGNSPVMTTDDLLPMLVFMVIKSEIANWYAHLTYMNHFRFSKLNNDDEFGYYLASLEAAIQHVTSGKLIDIVPGAVNPQRLTVIPTLKSDTTQTDQFEVSGEVSSIDRLFQQIKDGNAIAVKSLIRKNREESAEAKVKLCHPLCSCDRCEELLSKSRSDLETVTAFSRDDRGFTALHVSALYGHADIIEILAESGGVVNATDYHGSTPLHIACQKGHQNVTLMLLDKKAQVNAADNDGNTSLHLCTANGHEDCLKALVYYDRASLDVNAANDFGDTALHLAARWGYYNIVEILLENGASVEARNRKKLTPIQCAHNVNVSQLLIKTAKATTIEDKVEVQPTPKVNHSVPTPISPVITPTTPTKRRVSLSSAARLESEKLRFPQSQKIQKMLRAVADGDVEMVKFHLGWLENGDSDDADENIDLSKRKLCHPLCQCDKCIPLQKMTTSVAGSLTVDTCNNDGSTALHIASRHGHDFLVLLLIKRGANVIAKTKSQGCSPLHFASQYNKPKVVRLLMKSGAKVNVKDNRGNTPMHFAAINNCIDVVKRLIHYGGTVNQANMKGNTPLHEAARWNYFHMVELLVKEGASVQCRNKQHLTPMQLAQNDEIVNLLDNALIEQSNTVTSKNQMSRSPISVNSADSSPVTGRVGLTKTKRMSVRDLFAAFEDKDLKKLETLTKSVRSHRRETLRRTSTIDRSAPRLDLYFTSPDSSMIESTRATDRLSTPDDVDVDDDRPVFYETKQQTSDTKNPTENEWPKLPMVKEQELHEINEDMERIRCDSKPDSEPYLVVPYDTPSDSSHISTEYYSKQLTTTSQHSSPDGITNCQSEQTPPLPIATVTYHKDSRSENVHIETSPEKENVHTDCSTPTDDDKFCDVEQKM